MPKHVLEHLKQQDIRLYNAIVTFKKPVTDGPTTAPDLFASACRIIVGQQLSGLAARAIWSKFIALFPRKKPNVARILAMSDTQLRSAGLSFAKIRALRDLSERVKNRTLKLHTLRTLSEDEAREALLAVKGIGPWSCEMFLMFSLGYEDVFSPGDLGLQKGIQKIYTLKDLPDKEKIEKLSKKWSPYRTYVACAIWNILDNR